MQKRLLFLGGSHFQLPPILYAKTREHYIITCDYLPGNPGHKFANEYHNVSTTDMPEVLKLARSLKIDGVVNFASDASAPTAAYVCEQLGLPGNPLHSVQILTNKKLFRDFLKENNFNVPESFSSDSLNEVNVYIASKNFPLMIKPVDASGSKGVNRIEKFTDINNLFHEALKFSTSKKVIIEEFIQRKGFQIAGDGFVINGKLAFRCFAQEHFSNYLNPYAPIGESFPLQIPEAVQWTIHNEIERLLRLLNMKIGGLNFDIILDEEDQIYFLEIAPRSGGHLISEVIRYSTGIDLAKYIVDGALGYDCSMLEMYVKADYFSNFAIHAKHDGLFKELVIDQRLLGKIVEQKIFVNKMDPITSAKNAAGLIGCLILKFDSASNMIDTMENISDMIKVVV